MLLYGRWSCSMRMWTFVQSGQRQSPVASRPSTAARCPSKWRSDIDDDASQPHAIDGEYLKVCVTLQCSLICLFVCVALLSGTNPRIFEIHSRYPRVVSGFLFARQASDVVVQNQDNDQSNSEVWKWGRNGRSLGLYIVTHGSILFRIFWKIVQFYRFSFVYVDRTLL